MVLTGSHDNTARLWDVKTGKLLKVLEGHTHRVISVAYSPKGDKLLTGSYDETARLWSLDTLPCNWLEIQRETAFQLFMIFYPSSAKELRISKKPCILCFTQAINLDDDSQKECSIQ
ncbi:hypothetical protein H0W26_03020 [Candidatus Dependentiae bacterium]|nr:hypothetical protein [Candidatus Dependentiae bacterium]